MRSIAIINQKGGVGKTTTSVNLGAALARQGYKVCLLDIDPQAHASLHVGVALGDNQPSIYEVLTCNTPVAQVRSQVSENLHLVPAHINLAAAETELAGEVGRELILRDRLIADPESFDYLLIDCPPSLGLLTLNALCAVDEVFLPLQPHYLALHGMSKLLTTIDAVALRLNPRLRLSAVVLCLYESGTRLASEVAGDAEGFFAGQQASHSAWSEARVLKTRIRRNIRLAEAPSHGQSIFDYDGSSNGAEDYQALCAEVLAMNSMIMPRRVERRAA
jgi:chromosome partitioning protein